jgi:hypothetical protein
MKKGKHIIIRLLIIFIYIICLDGGRSFVMTGSKIMILFNHDPNESEVPYLHQIFNIQDDDKWIESFNLDLPSPNHIPSAFAVSSGTPGTDFFRPIWQPPKSF